MQERLLGASQAKAEEVVLVGVVEVVVVRMQAGIGAEDGEIEELVSCY